jgi:hypothetical protein
MRAIVKYSAASFVLATAISVANADVGVLDKYECHNHQETNKYHCHGPADLAKLGGFILGADARVQGWSASNGGVYLFAGVAVNAEYAHKWFAVTGSYFLMPMVTSANSEGVDYDDSVLQKGWEAGIKVGPGLGRLGSKAYLAAGWSSPDLTDSGDETNNANLAGYYAGAGFGANTNTLVFDVMATYRSPTAVSDYLTDQLSEAITVVHFDTRVSAGWRF